MTASVCGGVLLYVMTASVCDDCFCGGTFSWVGCWVGTCDALFVATLGGIIHAAGVQAKGLEGYQNSQAGSAKLPWGHAIASKLVHSKVKAALGLSKCKVRGTGPVGLPPSLCTTWGFQSSSSPFLVLVGRDRSKPVLVCSFQNQSSSSLRVPKPAQLQFASFSAQRCATKC